MAFRAPFAHARAQVYDGFNAADVSEDDGSFDGFGEADEAESDTQSQVSTSAAVLSSCEHLAVDQFTHDCVCVDAPPPHEHLLFIWVILLGRFSLLLVSEMWRGWLESEVGAGISVRVAKHAKSR